MVRHHAWHAFTVIGIATLIAPLDTAVNIAFPNITSGFGIHISDIQWVIICYVLTFASLTLVCGRLGDLFGHLEIFRLGLGVSAMAFLGCSLAADFHLLLAFRVVQGIGAAMVISCGPALMTRAFADADRARALGGYTMVLGLGSAIGPSFGGLLVEWGDWPAVFWFRIPLAAGALFLTYRIVLPAPARASGQFDLWGAVILALALASLLLAVNAVSKSDWVFALALLSGSALMFYQFVRQQKRQTTPLIRLDLFRDPDFSLLNIATIAVNAIGFSVWLLAPYFLLQIAGLSLTGGGLVLATGPLGMMLAGQYGSALIQKIGANRVAGLGALSVALGVLTVSFWHAEVSNVTMICCLMVHGFGLGLFQVASLEFVIARLPAADRGVAGSLAMVNRTLGLVFGASLLTLLFSLLQSQQPVNGSEFLVPFQQTFLIAGLALLALLAATFLRAQFWRLPPRGSR